VNTSATGSPPLTRRASELKVGDPAPPFELEDTEGRLRRLTDFTGCWVVLYFYPRDNTPGCTAEACAFRDSRRRLARRGATVLGVSGDSVASHARFAARHDLSFPLLSDASHAVSRAYGVWKEKTLYGRKSMGIERSTFVIDPEGRLRNIYRKVRVDGHVEEILNTLSSR
jgi:peroxiredoxin Q/BCP